MGVRQISSARSFFDHIASQANPYEYLKSLPDGSADHYPFFEEEWIDFKGEPRDDSNAREIWSKALSGYANITDGLIVWGIDARKTQPRDIDAACGLRLIADPSRFESKLRDWVRDSTNPPVVGVEYASYPGPEGSGFLACLIPESNHKPHRAEYCKKHYYYRAGDDFLIAEPGFLRSLFYPRSSPFLWAEVALKFAAKPVNVWEVYRKSPSNEGMMHLLNRGHCTLGFEIRLQNDGTATAKDIYIVIQTEHAMNYDPGVDWLMHRNPQGQAALKGKRSLHPGEVSVLFDSSFQDNCSLQRQAPSGSWNLIPYFEKASLRIIIYAENSERQIVTAGFTSHDFGEGEVSVVKRAIDVE